MLATQVRQKDGLFYFVSYPAEDLLEKVRFISRFYGEGAQIAPEQIPDNDAIARFIARVERTDGAFQRALSRPKVLAIKNFYETATLQPPIPGTVLLFTNEKLHFDAVASFQTVGHMQEPQSPFLIIDGQHRLAALHFYLKERPEEARDIHVPCMIFDGHAEDFAAEMFVLINSTPTRINKSHLVDLYERVSATEPDRKFAARLVDMLYREADSPLRYRINRLGGRSQQEKWILQAELFNEIYRQVKTDWARIQQASDLRREAERRYRATRDFLKAARQTWGEAWGHAGYVITKPVTLKAMVRVYGDLARQDAEPEDGRTARWARRLAPWQGQIRSFRTEGFYERFPAKGQVERVARIHKELARAIGIDVRPATKRAGP